MIHGSDIQHSIVGESIIKSSKIFYKLLAYTFSAEFHIGLFYSKRVKYHTSTFFDKHFIEIKYVQVISG